MRLSIKLGLLDSGQFAGEFESVTISRDVHHFSDSLAEIVGDAINKLGVCQTNRMIYEFICHLAAVLQTDDSAEGTRIGIELDGDTCTLRRQHEDEPDLSEPPPRS